MRTDFVRLHIPTPFIVDTFQRWENDDRLIPLVRPNRNASDLAERYMVTVGGVRKRLQDHVMYLIYVDRQLVGEMNYMINPQHLYKSEEETAWIGITIGEEAGRGKGIGRKALTFLEQEIKQAGLRRIELGVFEFNVNAYRLYQKLGYREIARLHNFTFYDGKQWADIRMEKYV
ncbi:GNAT family N-acetyltransferase [Halobacillus fulvus]|nr:GNAT family N-acetyltransferase [Halobacillus fulvus]